MAKSRKQGELPTLERKKLLEVNAAAEGYVEARDERMKRTETEVEARTALVAVMKKHSLTVYRDDEASPALLVTLTPGEDKVKVTRAEEEVEADE
jgi:hypothetical protein